MTVLSWLLKSSVSAIPGLALIWANKLIGFFQNSPQIAFRSWRADADSTAAAIGSGVIIVLAVGVSLIPWRWVRAIIAGLFLLATIFAAWKCYNFFDVLDTVKMSDSDAKQMQAVWRYWYILMQWFFVAAVTCGLTTMWSNKGKSGSGKPARRRNDETPDPLQGTGK